MVPGVKNQLKRQKYNTRPDGEQVEVDQPANDGFFKKSFETEAPWVALQTEGLEYGVGILYENGLSAFTAWQNRDLPFNNVRADFPFPIPARATIRARAYLLLGAFDTIAGDARWLSETLPPFGHLDTPLALPAAPGPVEVSGWALDNRGVESVFLRLDGVRREIPLEYGRSRPDVCVVWPGYPGCDDVGYTGMVDLGDVGCAHLLEVFARDTDGNERRIASSLLEP